MEDGRKRAIERLSLTSDDRILILGCGPGPDLKYLPENASITAVDAAAAMVRRTEERADALRMDVDARVGEAQAVPFDDDTFDVVLLHLILSVVPDPRAVAIEAARVVARNGCVSIYDKFIPEDTEPSFLRRTLNPIARFLFSDLTYELEPILGSAGLKIVKPRASALGGLYTIAQARPVTEENETMVHSCGSDTAETTPADGPNRE